VVIKLLKFQEENNAVSQVISILLVVSLVVSSMAIIIFWAMPLVEEKTMENEMQNILYSFEMMDNTIESMLIEGSGAKRVVSLMCLNNRGLLSMSSYTDKFIVMYSYDVNYNFYLTGLNDENDEFNIYMTDVGIFEEANIYFLEPESEQPPPHILNNYIYPSNYDVIDKETDITISSNTITASKPLQGNLLIDLFALAADTIPTGRIWVFNLGSVTYSAYYSQGAQETVFENGAILSKGLNGKGVTNEPSLITTPDAVALRIIQIKASSSYGGRGNPRLGIDLKNNIKREEPIEPEFDSQDEVNNLKFQVYGDNEESWLNYFKKIDGFEDDTDPNTVYYNIDGISFILDCSLVEIDIDLI